MDFKFTREWLERKLALGDDNNVAARGISLSNLKKEVEHLTVTPSALQDAPTNLGKVLRFVREQKGWTRTDLAQLADVDENEISSLETLEGFNPAPRTVTRLADTCNFSRQKFMELAQHRLASATNEPRFKYAANSGTTSRVTEEEYLVICELVSVLTCRD
jgi:transcriptional regulator with XRE-family HTH domain